MYESFGKHIEPIFGPTRAGDIRHSNADISKAKRLLGYEPEYDFERGLKEAIGWYKENLSDVWLTCKSKFHMKD